MGLLILTLLYLFAVGASVGSFLNVLVYRLPRDRSIVSPPSSCPSCNNRIRFYDNIPILSWLVLGGKCRNCSAKISPRYIIIEFITGMIFVALFWYYFLFQGPNFGFESADPIVKFFTEGGWLIYTAHLVLICAFLAGSAIDLELWVIPISLCWFVTIAGIVSSGAAPLVMEAERIQALSLFPTAGPRLAGMSLGAAIGLAISLILLRCGVIAQSYDLPEDENPQDTKEGEVPNVPEQIQQENEMYNHRREIAKEILFLMPVLTGILMGFSLTGPEPPLWWMNFSQHPVISGVLGSLWGYFAGCGIVWITRILGTLAFGREAMGLGDVHLMGAAGAVLGPFTPVVGFFAAPFFGLGWAVMGLIFQKRREIPYGPFLSMGVFLVMIFKDWFRVMIGAEFFLQ